MRDPDDSDASIKVHNAAERVGPRAAHVILVCPISHFQASQSPPANSVNDPYSYPFKFFFSKNSTQSQFQSLFNKLAEERCINGEERSKNER